MQCLFTELINRHILICVKRKELEKKLNQLARSTNKQITWAEGGNHSKVCIGELTITVPRHNEINEITARSIIKYFERNLQA